MSLHMQLIKARKNGGMIPGRGPMILPAFQGQRIGQYNGGMMYSRGRQGQAGGIFGSIGKVLAGIGGTILSGVPVVGDVLKGIAAGSLDSKKSKTAGPAGNLNPQVSVAQFAGSGPGMGSGGGMFPNLPSLPMIGGGTPTSTGGTMVGTDAKPGVCAPGGYHWNKSGYWSNESNLLPGASWTPPGTKLVKNRKRNPYNPRAASRAMSRLASLSQGMKVLERQLTKLAPRKRTSCGGKCATKRK
jgi:hypothetical protein